MNKRIAEFATDECGAVTVDWVVLTAALVGIGMIVLTPIAYSTDSTAQIIGSSISDRTVGYGN